MSSKRMTLGDQLRVQTRKATKNIETVKTRDEKKARAYNKRKEREAIKELPGMILEEMKGALKKKTASGNVSLRGLVGEDAAMAQRVIDEVRRHPSVLRQRVSLELYTYSGKNEGDEQETFNSVIIRW